MTQRYIPENLNPLWHYFSPTSQVSIEKTFFQENRTVLPLANAGPNCDPCGRLLKVTVQSKKRTNIFGILTWVKWSSFII
jgi:hypothetical protein